MPRPAGTAANDPSAAEPDRRLDLGPPADQPDAVKPDPLGALVGLATGLAVYGLMAGRLVVLGVIAGGAALGTGLGAMVESLRGTGGALPAMFGAAMSVVFRRDFFTAWRLTLLANRQIQARMQTRTQGSVRRLMLWLTWGLIMGVLAALVIALTIGGVTALLAALVAAVVGSQVSGSKGGVNAWSRDLQRQAGAALSRLGRWQRW